MSQSKVESCESLPRSWTRVRVGDVLSLVNGFAFKPSHWKKEGLPIIRIQNLNNQEAPYNYCTDSIPEKFRVKQGELLFAWSGTPGTSFGAHIWKGGAAWLNQHIFRINFTEELFDRRFLQLAINANLADYIASAHGGAGLAHITIGKFRDSVLLLAPLNEQVRIVAEIEKQFTRLDAAVAALNRVQANLKRYRAAILKAACEGRLVPTEAELARKEGRSYETGEQLLARILEERHAKWEADQLVRLQAAAKLPKDDSWKEKYTEPEPPDTTGLTTLPGAWIWTSLDAVALVVDPNPSHRMPHYVTGGIPFISSENFRGDNEIDFKIGKTVSKETLAEQVARFKLREGDFALSRIGTIGKTRDLPMARNYCLSHALVVIQAASEDVRSEYLRIACSSAAVSAIAKSGVQSVGVPDLGMGKIRSLPVPLPPIQEQDFIVAEIMRSFSLLEEIGREVELNMVRAGRLRQSILKSSFEGKLVPQDPNDEPASVLLERNSRGTQVSPES